MRTNYDIIVKPVITEQSMYAVQERKYTFYVLPDANKIEIKKACEELFGIKVEKVNTSTIKGKFKRMGVHSGYRSDRKKAVVTITPDSKTIEFFDGMM